MSKNNLNNQRNNENASSVPRSWAQPRWQWTVLVTVLALLLIFYIDFEVAQYFNDHRGGVRWVFKKVTTLGDSAWYLAPTALVAGYWGLNLRRGQRVGAGLDWLGRRCAYLFCTVASSALVVNAAKAIFGRARWREFEGEGAYGFYFWQMDSGYQSFPSGHSATIFSVMLTLAYLYPRYTWIFMWIAVIVAFSRVAINAHFPSDVLIGSYIAWVTAWYLKGLFERRRWLTFP